MSEYCWGVGMLEFLEEFAVSVAAKKEAIRKCSKELK
jgi:hypothetical protein